MAIKINAQRFLRELETQGKINWKDGYGLDQAGFSPQFYAARDYVRGLMEEAGLQTRIDSVGNLFGRLPGSDSQLPTIISGSHLDAVAGGGIYDGMLGVFTALEAARSLRENGVQLKHDFEVVAFNAEEGGPLGGTFGSRSFCGLVNDLPAAEAMAAAGIGEAEIKAVAVRPEGYLCFLETHIEQGPVLDRRGLPIGIPTGIVGITRLRCVIEGIANHAGTTPMTERLDAYRVMAEATARWIAQVAQTPDTVCNIAELQQEPGQIGVITGRMGFTAEIRAQEQDDIEQAALWLNDILHEYEGFRITVERVAWKPPVQLDLRLISLIEQAGAELGIPTLRMPSGASHDASPMSKIMPTCMIFVPSVKGISHNKDEYTAAEDLVRGAVLHANAIMLFDQADL